MVRLQRLDWLAIAIGSQELGGSHPVLTLARDFIAPRINHVVIYNFAAAHLERFGNWLAFGHWSTLLPRPFVPGIGWI